LISVLSSETITGVRDASAMPEKLTAAARGRKQGPPAPTSPGRLLTPGGRGDTIPYRLCIERLKERAYGDVQAAGSQGNAGSARTARIELERDAWLRNRHMARARGQR